MAAAKYSPETLIETARKQLRIVDKPNATVPKFYLDELKKHISLYPNDTSFLVDLQPGVGYGSLTCLERGCENLQIPLTERAVPGGGMSDGFGTLSAYEHHIAFHPTHLTNREERLKASANPSNGALNSNIFAPLVELAKRDAPFKSARRVSAGFPGVNPLKANPRRVSMPGPASIKVEPEETVVSRKRQPNFLSQVDEEPEREDGLTKRPKLEPRSPLGSINRNFLATPQVMGSPSALPSQLAKPTITYSEAKEKLNSIEMSIRSRRHQISLIQSKKKRSLSASDKMRIQLMLEEINGFEKTRRECLEVIQDPQCVSSPNAIGTSNATRVVSRVSPDFASSAMNPAVSTVKVEQRSPAEGLPFTAVKPELASSGTEDDSLFTPAQASGKPEPSTYSSPLFTSPAVPRSTYMPSTYSSDTDADFLTPNSGGLSDEDAEDLFVQQTTAQDPVGDLESSNELSQRLKDMMPDSNPLNVNDFEYHPEVASRAGRNNFEGPQANEEDINTFLIDAGNAELFDGNESVDKALGKLGLKSQYEALPGMEVALMAHQVIGVAWLVEMERKKKIMGGLLADEMGLGKTVQMIALMVKNCSDDSKKKTNLVVAPLSLLDQWKREIEDKTNCGLKCLIYHGPSKTKSETEILKHDVVITTYATMANEWYDEDEEVTEKAKARRKKKSRGEDWLDDSEDEGPRVAKRNKKKELAPLFRVDFYRIILDEAQTIRNRVTKASRASTQLDSVYRWCLTGTPIVNSLQDVFSYVRFIKLRPWYDWSDFHKHISIYEKKNPALAVSRLQAVMSTFKMRRTKLSKLDGKRLIELPEKTVNLIKLDFSEKDREFYNALESKSQDAFNKFLRAGTVMKNYTQVLVLLLRLRQFCSHPALVLEKDGSTLDEMYEEVIEPGDRRAELARAKKLISPQFVEKMKEKMKEQEHERAETERDANDAAAEGPDRECPLCLDMFADAVVTPCMHLFCRECIMNVVAGPRDEGSDLPANSRPCPVCRSAITENKLFALKAFEPTEGEFHSNEDEDEQMDVIDLVSPEHHTGVRRSLRPKRTQSYDDSSDALFSDDDISVDGDDDDDMSDFIVQSDEDEALKDKRRKSKAKFGKNKKRAMVIESDDEDEDLPAGERVIFGAKPKNQLRPMRMTEKMSRKMEEMMKILQKNAEEHPEEKTLIISQWTQNLSLVSGYLTEKNILHVKYQGDMNRKQREKAVKVFMSKDKATVMLMSLKCGGVGLNLTRANRVISLDLGWSMAVESQAYDRVHRLGQMRSVNVDRLVIVNTVEDRVLALQERKQNLADGSLAEGNGKKIGRLSVEELANLFGLDHRGCRL